ncbi:MAG: CBS domain-containing protein [Deltaproteobacteria bacterium]|nr:CBS domain-containing protein [Deltaproteobacteria bacterium]MBI2532181.1 CBS domain-containing protein [Deltaproteobacteria bacterium]
MLVGKRMSKDPVTVTAEDLLIQARLKMQRGGFRRLPVVSDGQLVGIITDRDIREHAGYLDRTVVKTAMSKKPVTVTPATTLETAAQILLKRKIGGLPVMENGRLVGVITTSDILQAFLDVMGASEETSKRIDFVLREEGGGVAEASKIVAQEGGEVLGVGTYRGKWGDTPVCYLRLRSGDANAIAKFLKEKGFEVLGVHDVAGSSTP